MESIPFLSRAIETPGIRNSQFPFIRTHDQDNVIKIGGGLKSLAVGSAQGEVKRLRVTDGLDSKEVILSNGQMLGLIRIFCLEDIAVQR